MPKVYASRDSLEAGRHDSFPAEVSSTASPYLLPLTVGIVHATTTLADLEIDLPPIAESFGRFVRVVNLPGSSNNVLLDPNGTETIQGSSASLSLPSGDSITLHGGSTEWKILQRGRATIRTIFIPVNQPTGVLDNYIIQAVGSNSSFNISAAVPQDFGSLVAMELFAIPSAGAAGAGKDIDLTSSYGQPGASITQHTESDTTSTYTVGAANTHWAFDVSAVFSSLQPNDIMGLLIKHNLLGGIVSYTGISIRYLPA